MRSRKWPDVRVSAYTGLSPVQEPWGEIVLFEKNIWKPDPKTVGDTVPRNDNDAIGFDLEYSPTYDRISEGLVNTRIKYRKRDAKGNAPNVFAKVYVNLSPRQLKRLRSQRGELPGQKDPIQWRILWVAIIALILNLAWSIYSDLCLRTKSPTPTRPPDRVISHPQPMPPQSSTQYIRPTEAEWPPAQASPQKKAVR